MKRKQILAFFIALWLCFVSAQAFFSDVEGNWAWNSIYRMYARDIVNGYEDGTFRPEEMVAYGEAAKMICLAADLKPVEFGTNDVAGMAGQWSSPYLRALPVLLVETDGVSEQVQPDSPLIREDAAYIIAKTLERNDSVLNAAPALTFTDASGIDAYAEPGVRYAAAHGIIGGYADGTFRPKDTITRAEMCTILLRAWPDKPAEQIPEADETQTSEVDKTPTEK